MKILSLIDEDFSNYKDTSMVVCFPTCTFKCEKEGCVKHCHGKDLLETESIIETTPQEIVERYQKNPYSKALICSGLEPLDSFDDVEALLRTFREVSNDPFIIYTGYTLSEALQQIVKLKKYGNLIVKYGRMYDINFFTEKKFDPLLGVELASSNQYARKYEAYNVKVVRTQDFDTVMKSVQENDGYCPCKANKIPENKCMCNEFKEQFRNSILGECHCGAYKVIKVPE